MHDRQAISILRLLCGEGPQFLANLHRGGVDNLIGRGLASLTKRGLAVSATTQGYAFHKATYSAVGRPSRR
jgi:hypothetical protein